MRSRLRPSPKPVPLKILNVTDEFTREALASEAGRSIDASATVKVLAELVRRRGAPFYVRCDSGPAAASLGGPSLPVREGPPPRRKACRRTYFKAGGPFRRHSISRATRETERRRWASTGV